MGVRGLTSYIARNAEQYLTPYELHDCNLVIDGDNLACNIYKDVTGTCSAFGGDYDDYYNAVRNFFQVLAECNIEPYVLMDGGYERKKLRTVGKRLRGKIAVIKRINPCGSVPVFPQMMKEVFVDAVRDCNVPIMRCVFEADDELATLSRKLGCPVLTYDSDFYIYNVQYIPLVTLTVKAHTKRLHVRNTKQGSAAVPSVPTRKLRKNEAKHIEKLTNADRILGEIQVNNVEKRAAKKVTVYKYLDCCMYTIENLITRRSLTKEKLPLFAAMLGNDYIARSNFRNFFATGMGKAGRSRKLKQQQRRIRAILDWLKQESLESALNKIVTRLKLSERESLLAQVNAATSGYSNEQCHSYNFFVTYYDAVFKTHPPREDADCSAESTEEEDQLSDNEDTESEAASASAEEEHNEDDADSIVEDDAEHENNEALANGSGDNNITESADEEEQNDSNDDELVDENDAQGVKQENENDDDDGDFNDYDDDDEDDSEDDMEDKTKLFPTWFLEKLYPAHLPRFLVDLVHLRKYINSPQIEHFPYHDCNEIALPILIYTFTLLNSVEGDSPEPQLDENGEPLPIQFTYMTRATRVTNIRYYTYEMETERIYNFNPSSPNPLLLRRPFEGTMRDLDTDKLFEKVALLPKDLQLYFLSIVYWLHKSQHCDLVHLHALLICAVTLRTIDSKIPPERNLKAFHKRFGKIIKTERLVRDKEAQLGIKRTIKDDVRALPPQERINFVTKSDCYLVQENLLKHFHMPEIFKKKYDLFSTTVLHAFAEFQSIVFQMYALNGLLNHPFEPTKMGNLYSGIFLYNLYDLLKNRVDINYYVENFIYRDSQMMLDFYLFLLEWCDMFVPEWKRKQLDVVTQTVNKKLLKKKRQAARKLQAAQESADPNADMVDRGTDTERNAADGADDFFDLNNKFCAFLQIK